MVHTNRNVFGAACLSEVAPDRQTDFHEIGMIFLKIILQYAIMGVFLLASAGTLNWLRAWIFLGLGLFCFAVNATLVVRKNPQMIAERHRKHKDTKSFDRVLTGMIMATTVAMWIVAGLDAVRFSWSALPAWTLYPGIFLHISGMAIIGWVMVINPYVERSVRIQTDRGQQVIRTGPYRFVRHPMYFAMILLGLGCPAVLGSAWSLALLAPYVSLFVMRTGFEDGTLRRELPGYEEYSWHTRYRLLPGLW